MQPVATIDLAMITASTNDSTGGDREQVSAEGVAREVQSCARLVRGRQIPGNDSSLEFAAAPAAGWAASTSLTRCAGGHRANGDALQAQTDRQRVAECARFIGC